MIKYIRNGARVRRYHTVDLCVPETVGHHSFNVAMLCLHLDPNCRKEVLVAALTHDLPEQFTGDVPATAKWDSMNLSVALAQLEDEKDIFSIELTPAERRLMKQADMLDLCLKCAEELRMGNTTLEPILARGVAYLWGNTPLTETIRILQELEHEFSK